MREQQYPKLQPTIAGVDEERPPSLLPELSLYNSAVRTSPAFKIDKSEIFCGVICPAVCRVIELLPSTCVPLISNLE